MEGSIKGNKFDLSKIDGDNYDIGLILGHQICICFRDAYHSQEQRIFGRLQIKTVDFL